MKKTPLKIKIQPLLPSKTEKEIEALIRTGQVLVDEQVILQPNFQVKTNSILRIKEQSPFVSRGGDKLFQTLEKLNIKDQFQNKIILDVGSSTGGFTDVMLHLGAKKVFAVDSGFNQLDWKLRQDSRVMVFEKTDIRDFKIENFTEKIDWVLMDVSFVSVLKVLPAIFTLMKNFSAPEFLILIKPQFEVTPDIIPQGGVITDPNIQKKACDEVTQWIKSQNYMIKNLLPSPVL